MNIRRSSPTSKVGICSFGNPEAISPIRRMPSPPSPPPLSRVSESTVPITRAISWGGAIFFTFAGVSQRIASVISARSTSVGRAFASSWGRALRVPITPPLGIACPRNGPICRITRMKPIPLMKPEITVYGIWVM